MNRSISNQIIHEYNVEKALYGNDNAFIHDFAFADIAPTLKRHNIFTDAELKSIQLLDTERERIDKMFFLIVYKNKNIEDFLNVLRVSYDWLAIGIEDDLKIFNDNSVDDEFLFQKIRQLRKEIPRHIDYNVHRCGFLWKIKQKLLTLAAHEYLVVHGSLAFGKRWVAMDACCNYKVMNEMGGQIFWINCSKCKTPEAIFQSLEALAIIAMADNYTVTNNKDINNKIVQLTQELRRSFQKNGLYNSLIVLIDVQTYDTIKAFDLNCKTMVTTGNKWILDKLPASTINFEIASGFTRDETLELFSKVLDRPVADLPNEAEELHRICKQNPFLISLVANMLKESTTSSDVVRWKHIVDNVTNHQSTNHTEIKSLIQKSLMELPPEYVTLFHSLVIFPESVSIPIRALELYWNKNRADAIEIIRKLDKLYLLDTKYASDGETFCSLHYFYYSYLINHINDKAKEVMHKKLVDNYKIMQALENRTEPDIIDLPDDRYFHFFIGYHLKNANMKEIFPKLYLDFGFLEQKLRSTGLSNMLGDFSEYKDEITGGDKTRTILLDHLMEFLPTIEEFIVKSRNTCLLQYAITADKAIREEAIKQAQKFPQRIWFGGMDHSFKHRQIVQLPQKPQLIRFVHPDYSLIVFADKSILLTDMSTQYTVEPTVHTGHDAAIIDLQVFKDDYFISLDVSGIIKIWSLSDTAVGRRRRSKVEQSVRLVARQNMQSECFGAQNATQGICIQTIDNRTKNCKNLSLTLQLDLRVFIGAEDGFIRTYQWNDQNRQFEYRRLESFHTRFGDVKQLSFIPPQYLMVHKTDGTNAFFNLKDHSQVPRTQKIDKLSTESPIGVHMIISPKPLLTTRKTPSTMAIIYCNRIYSISISVYANVMTSEMRILQLSDEDQNFITCSAVTEDNQYLILGTKKGIIVYDPHTGSELLRSSVSDNITCVDVCSVDQSDGFKYIIMSATKKGGPSINMHGIIEENGTMQWVSNKIGSPIIENNLNGRDSVKAWLSGGQLFDVVEDTKNDNSFKMVAADSRCFVHQKSSKDRFVQSLSTERITCKITALSIGWNSGYVACENGFVYKYEVEQPYMVFANAVRFLKFYGELDIVIAGTEDQYQIRIRSENCFAGGRDSCQIVQSFLYDDRFIILAKEDCSMDIFDVREKTVSNRVPEDVRVQLHGCDMFEKTVLIGTSASVIHEYHVQPNINDSINVKWMREFDVNKSLHMTSLAFTIAEKSILAIGYKTGEIEVYDCLKEKVQLIQQLKSNKDKICTLSFSPWINTQTLILISVSDELCFWNITHILNNPLEGGNIRRSQRFSRRHSKSSIASTLDIPQTTSEVINGNQLTITNGHTATGTSATVANGTTNGFNNCVTSPMTQLYNSFNNLHLSPPTVNEQIFVSPSSNVNAKNPWIGKTGALAKPELLSCIKFVGNVAEKIYTNNKFTKFITIDNEGEIYYLDLNYTDNI